MLLLAAIALVAVSGLSMLWTMKEYRIEKVRLGHAFKMWGLGLLFWLPLVGFQLYLNHLSTQ